MGHILSLIGAAALIWLPLLMFGLIIYLLWRTLQVMPRVAPKHVHATSKTSVTGTKSRASRKCATRCRRSSTS